MVKPFYEIRMVKENLDLSMALLQAVQEEKITARQLFRDGPEGMVFAFAVSGNGPDQIELTRRAANQARAAFALSVIQTQRSLDRVFAGPPIEEPHPDLQAARCVMFLLNNTVSPNLFSPVWDCPPEYRRRFEVRPINLLMDAGELHGKALSWDHVGGLPQYLELLEYFSNWIEDLHEIDEARATGSTDLWENAPEEKPKHEMVLVDPAPAARPASPEETDSPVARFINERCEVGSRDLVLAKELYSGFQNWCRETGRDDVSQRAFGMQLTAMGFQRRRRGRGKHWWDGIRLSGSAQMAMGEMEAGGMGTGRRLVLANGLLDGYQPELPT